VPGIYGGTVTPPGCVEATIDGSFTDGSCNGPTGTPDNITLFQQPTCYTAYCVQSGGTMSLANHASWKVPFVDFATGIDSDATIYDPATYPSWAALGCQYLPTGNGLGGPQLNCSPSTGVVGDLTLGRKSVPGVPGFGFNFGEVGGHGCTSVYMAAQTGFTTTLINSYFNRGSATFGQAGTCFGNANSPNAAKHLYIGGQGANDKVVMSQLVFDYGTPITQGFDAIAPRVNTGGSISMRYIHVKNAPGNPIQSSPVGFSLDFRYNSIDGYTFSGSQNHGEVYNLNGGGNRSTFYDINNFVMHTTAGVSNNTADHWIEAPTTGTTSLFIDAQVIGNTSIGNCTSTLPTTSPQACGSGAANLWKQVGSYHYLGAQHQQTQIKKNFVWASAAQNGVNRNAGGICVLPAIISGNIDMQDGSAQDSLNETNASTPFTFTGSVTSNVLTTTSQGAAFQIGNATSSRIKDGSTILGRVGAQIASGETGYWDGTFTSTGFSGTVTSTVHGAIQVGMRLGATRISDGVTCASSSLVTAYNAGTGAISFGTSTNCTTGANGWSRNSAQTTGRINGTTLTIESVGGGGVFYPGMLLDGVGVTPGTSIGASFCSAGNTPGSTCTVTISQTVASGTVIHGGSSGGVGSYNLVTPNISSRTLNADSGCT
jgi:hypothetical protein